MSRLKQLIQEIHRRSLWQVLAIYLAISWVVYEVVQSLTEGLGLPQWFPAFAFVLILIGLPIVVATAFVQEGISATTRQDPTLLPGAELESEARPREVAGARRLFTWRNAITGGVLALALWGVVATGWLLFGGSAAASDEDVDDRSIAVLPFDDFSSGSDQEWFAAGMQEALITALQQIGALRVTSRTSAMLYKETGLSSREIADELRTRWLVEGSVLRDGDRIRISAQLIDGSRDEPPGSESWPPCCWSASLRSVNTVWSEPCFGYSSNRPAPGPCSRRSRRGRRRTRPTRRARERGGAACRVAAARQRSGPERVR